MSEVNPSHWLKKLSTCVWLSVACDFTVTVVDSRCHAEEKL